MKELIKTWPEEKANGEPTEVWVERHGSSNPVYSVWPLNPGEGNKPDLLLNTVSD